MEGRVDLLCHVRAREPDGVLGSGEDDEPPVIVRAAIKALP
jgi:hypothetical protein